MKTLDPLFQQLQQRVRRNVAIKQKFGQQLKAVLGNQTEITELPLILVIEDDETLCRAYGRGLGRQARLLVAHNSEEAVELLQTHHPSLIITDSVGIDAIEAFFGGKKDCPPILLISGFPSYDKLSMPCEILEKPVDLGTLRAKIDLLLQNKQTQ